MSNKLQANSLEYNLSVYKLPELNKFLLGLWFSFLMNKALLTLVSKSDLHFLII